MRGVWFVVNSNGEYQPGLWWAYFPDTIQDNIITHDNPAGTIFNSDPELAGTIAHHDILSQHYNISKCTIAILSDNTFAIAWQQKGSATTTGPVTYLH